MNETPTFRCTHYPASAWGRCQADATHRLRDENGKRVPGKVLCKEHAHEIITEYREKLGWNWTMEPLDPQAARIAELEAKLSTAQQTLQALGVTLI